MYTQVFEEILTKRQQYPSFSKAAADQSKNTFTSSNSRASTESKPLSFKDVLGTTAGQKTTRQQVSSRESQGGSSDVKDASDKEQTCFKKICGASIKPKDRAVVTSISDNAQEGNAKVSDTSSGTEIAAVCESLAQLLGISQTEFNELLGTFNMDPSQITEDDFASKLSVKLGNMLKLDDSQCRIVEQAIKTLIMQTASQDCVKQGSAVETIIPADQKLVMKPTESQLGKEQAYRPDTKTIGYPEQLTSKIMNAISNLGQAASVGPEKLEQYIKQIVFMAAQNSPLTENRNIVSEKIPVGSDNAQVEEMDDMAVIQPITENGGLTADTEGDNRLNLMSHTGEAILGEVNEEKPEMGQDASSFGTVLSEQTNRPRENMEILKEQNQVQVGKDELISQVVEKAKVVIDGHKSELVMDLKPDNLGKLSLKIATERGVVLAKFTAESEQVKAILESNMQLLKDSLEKQGLSVNALSVSVQQESRQGAQNFNEKSGNESRIKVPGLRLANNTAEAEAAIERSTYAYLQGSSTIDLIA